MEPHDYRIYYANIDLRHQYGISVTESETFLRAKRPQRRRARRNGCFRRLVLHNSRCISARVKFHAPRGANAFSLARKSKRILFFICCFSLIQFRRNDICGKWCLNLRSCESYRVACARPSDSRDVAKDVGFLHHFLLHDCAIILEPGAG